jgi:hypothetical protein
MARIADDAAHSGQQELEELGAEKVGTKQSHYRAQPHDDIKSIEANPTTGSRYAAH